MEISSLKIPVPAAAKGLIFDLDGTLLDTMPLHFEGYNHALKPYGVHYPKSVFYSRGGIPTRDTLLMIADENNITEFNVEQALEAKCNFVEDNLQSLQLIMPVFDVVKTYFGKLPIAVGTGSSRKVVTELFERFSLQKYIRHVVTATDVSNHKPHPETFLKCASLMGIKPEYCVVFEDGKPGMQAAKEAGMNVIDITEYL